MNDLERIEEQVRRLGPNFDDEIFQRTKAIYSSYAEISPCATSLNVPYGTDARHVLDVYRPESRPIGVFIFVHGGGFVAGDKGEDELFYGNVGRYFSRAGYLTVLPNYRLAPEFSWPAAARDVRDAVEWARQYALSEWGELPVFVCGQSAGASHVSSWFFDNRTRERALGRVDGLLLMSGLYRVAAGLTANAASYFGLNAGEYAIRSPIAHVQETSVPIWLSVAEFDPGPMAARTYDLAQVLSVANKSAPEIAWLAGHNHVSTVMSIGSPQTGVGERMLSFMARQASNGAR